MKGRYDEQQQQWLRPLLPMPQPAVTTAIASGAARIHQPPYFQFGWAPPYTYAQQGWWWPRLLSSSSSQTPASVASASAQVSGTPNVVSLPPTSQPLSSLPPIQIEEECVDVSDVEMDKDDTAFVGDAPCEDMEFATHEDAYIFYNSYARKMGFGIRKDKIEKSRSDSSKVLSRTFVCNKAGKKCMSDKREYGKAIIRRQDTRVDCGAKLKICLIGDKWVVRKFVEQHSNHELSSPDKVLHHFSHKQKHRSGTIKKVIGDLSEAGMGPSNIARVLNVGCEGGDGERITPRQCSDHIKSIRKNNIGNECISIIRNFQDRREIDPDFYFAMEVDHSGQMRSVFWADGRSRSSYLRLGDVVVFDTTYRTNQFSLPFAPFTGLINIVSPHFLVVHCLRTNKKIHLYGCLVNGSSACMGCHRNLSLQIKILQWEPLLKKYFLTLVIAFVLGTLVDTLQIGK